MFQSFELSVQHLDLCESVWSQFGGGSRLRERELGGSGERRVVRRTRTQDEINLLPTSGLLTPLPHQLFVPQALKATMILGVVAVSYERGTPVLNACESEGDVSFRGTE